MYDKSNIFRKIADEDIVVNMVYSTMHTIVIKDIKPQNNTHLLIIPKGHYTNFYEFCKHASNDEKIDYMNTYTYIIEHYKLNDSYININSGTYQDIMHFHMHVLSNKEI